MIYLAELCLSGHAGLFDLPASTEAKYRKVKYIPLKGGCT